MKNPRLYRRSKQKEGAKRMEFLLDVRCVQILNDLKTRHNKSYTKIVENLILNSQISFYKQQKITSALGSLAILYSSLNATCSNFNQIAYHLNNAALLGENVIHLGLLQDIEAQLKSWSEKTKILNLAIKKSAFIVAHCLKGDKKIFKGMNL
ncbi:mobilization protein [Helicobacter pylori]